MRAHLPPNERDRRRPTPVLRGIAVTAALLALAGCTTGKETHTATSTSTTAAPALNPGNYPTKPHPEGNAGTPAIGAVAEARRMGENVIQPFQVDPELIKGGNREGPFTDPKMLSDWFDKPMFEAAGNHHFLAGFLASHTTAAPETLGQSRDKELMNGVLRFATEADAAATAAEMAAHSPVLDPIMDGEPPRPTTRMDIAGHPETAAYGYVNKLGGAVVQAYTAHGIYVIVQWATTTAGLQPSADLIAGAVNQQLPLIDAFTPTPEDQLASLPRDPSGLTARTLPPDKNSTHTPGDYGPHAMLVFLSNAPRDQKLFESAGVDAAAISRADIYRARDAAGASAVAADFAAEMRERKWLPAPAIPGIPGSQCLSQKPGTNAFKANAHYFYCTFSTGRYAVEAQGPQRGEVDQAAAAQYLMLTAP